MIKEAALVFAVAFVGVSYIRVSESVQLQALRAHIDKGRTAFDDGRWRDADAILAAAGPMARALKDKNEKLGIWSELQAAEAHRAKAQFRLSSALRGTERSSTLAKAEAQFDFVLQMDEKTGLTVHDFIHDYSRLLWQVGKVSESEVLFQKAKQATVQAGGSFPWDHSSQMPSEEVHLNARTLPLPPTLTLTLSEVNPALRTEKATPWYQPAESKIGRLLLQNRAMIESEVASLVKALELEPERQGLFRSLEGHGTHREADQEGNQRSMLGGWTELMLFSNGHQGLDGQWHSKNCELVPKTCSLLRHARLPELEGLPTRHVSASSQQAKYCCRVELLRLLPGTHILPHTAPTNQRLKAHLGLIAPPENSSALVVAGKTETWEAGKVLIFDDSYWHEAYNKHGSQERWVLSADFWKPELVPTL